MTDQIEITDIYKRRDDLRRDLAAVEAAIERCRHPDWSYTPAAAFEDRDGAWVRVTYRTSKERGVINERVDATPRGALGEWCRATKFKVTA